MLEINFDEALEKILARDPRFSRDAYHFVRESLDYTQKLISKENRGGLRWAVLTWRARRDRPGGRHDDDRESCDSRYQ